MIVKLVLSLPMTIEEFSIDKQAKFRQAIAGAAGVNLSKVRIVSITPTSDRRQRRLLDSGINVDVEVAADSTSAARTVVGQLNADNINQNLKAAGLPEAEIVVAPYLADESPSSGNFARLVTGIAIPILLICAVVGFQMVNYCPCPFLVVPFYLYMPR